MLRPQLLRGALRPCLEGAAGFALQTASPSLVGSIGESRWLSCHTQPRINECFSPASAEPSQLLLKQPLRQAPRHVYNLTFDTRYQHSAALLEQGGLSMHGKLHRCTER
jgi:hypothetical protein